MDASAYDRLKADFLKTPVEKWGALVSSVGVALTYLFLLVLLYLFVDLLVWRGRVPTYAELTPARQREFATEWADRQDADRADAVRRLTTSDPLARRLAAADPTPAPTAAEWELRYRAGLYLAVRDLAGQPAADALLPEKPAAAPEPPPRLGVLSLVARERNRWSGKALGAVASAGEWMWRPGAADNPNPQYLTGLFVIALAAAAARGVLVNAMTYLAAAARLDIVTRLRRAIYLQTFRLGSVAVRTAGPAEPVNLFTRQADAVGGAVHATLTSAYRIPVLVLGLLALILLVNFWLAVSFLLLAGLVWLIGGQVVAHFRREARLGSRQAESSLALLVESIGLLRLAKCYNMDRFNQTRVERQLAESGRSAWRKLRGEALARPLLGAVALLAGVALLYLAGWSVLAGEFTTAGLAVVAVALVSLGPPIADWVGSRLKLRRGREAADAVVEYLARRGDAAEANDAEYLPPLQARLEFRSVKLEDPGTGRLLLENVSFAVPHGTRVAVVGPGAEEKRALAYLIPRFNDPTAGEIRVDDRNIRWVTHESLRAQVALVMHDDWVFTDTVANNISCGDPQFNLPQVIEAAKLAHAHQFIEKLPYGYETVVGDLGHVLKPGERFRLALARALVRDPSILVIEEPAGQMDEDTLALLDDTLERASAGRTIIFLASRLSTLRSVKRVFLLRDGHLIDSGTHRDLWQRNEYYRRLQVVADSTAEAAAVGE